MFLDGFEQQQMLELISYVRVADVGFWYGMVWFGIKLMIDAFTDISGFTNLHTSLGEAQRTLFSRMLKNGNNENKILMDRISYVHME